MAENSSRMSGAQESTEAHRSPEKDSCIRDDIVKEANMVDSLQDSEGYVSSVMSSQPIVPVLRTPMSALTGGRKSHLSLPAVSDTDLKKIRSDANDSVAVDENSSGVGCSGNEDEGD